jgi:hypothetical protein
LAQLPSLFIRPFFLKKKDQKFKPALRRMLKHRKNVALHAQFFARWRYRGCPADTNCRDCATSLLKAKNHSSASFFLSLVRLAALRGMLSVDSNSGSAFKRRFELKKISENLRYLRETNISPRTTMRSFLTSRAYWPQLPSLFIRPFFLKKKDQKFKPALRRMLKHRKNVALHAQFFARVRYRVQPPYLKQKITVPLHFSFRW